MFASFLPAQSAEAFEAELLAEAGRESRRSVLNALKARLPESLAWKLIAFAAVPPDRALGQLRSEERRALAYAVCERELPVTGVMGYKKAEVTADGVPPNDFA